MDPLFKIILVMGFLWCGIAAAVVGYAIAVHLFGGEPETDVGE